LIVSSLLIETHSTPANHMKTIFRKEAEDSSLHSEKNSPDLAEIIFECEIEMSRRRLAKV